MQKKTKKFLSIFLTFLMFVSVIPLQTRGESDLVNQVQYNPTPKTTEDKLLTYQKSIKQTGKDAFTITLDVTTEQEIKTIPGKGATVVLVLDTSGSMVNAFAELKAAATVFGANLLEKEGTKNKLALITYNSNYDFASDAKSQIAGNFTNSQSTFYEAVNKILSPAGMTNIQAGLHKANTILAEDQSDNKKFIVLFSDGEANLGAVPTAAKALDQNNPKEQIVTATYNEYLYDLKHKYTTFNYGAIQQMNPVSFNDFTTDTKVTTPMVCAISEAFLLKEQGYDIYSVFFNNTTALFDNQPTQGAFTAQNCASAPENFIQVENASDLPSAFETMDQKITTSVSPWKITDPMGSFINFNSFVEASPAGASFESSNILTWDLKDPNVQGTPLADKKYKYSLSYNITLNSKAEGFDFKELYPTNGKTTLDYYYAKTGESTGTQKVAFEVPIVKSIAFPVSPKSLAVNKQWQHGNNANRPTEVMVQLYKDNTPEGGLVTLNEANHWSHTWTGLDGTAQWRVDEPNLPSGYVKQMTTDTTQNPPLTTITNVHTSLEITSLKVEKQWDHKTNPTPATKVLVQLFRDGVAFNPEDPAELSLAPMAVTLPALPEDQPVDKEEPPTEEPPTEELLPEEDGTEEDLHAPVTLPSFEEVPLAEEPSTEVPLKSGQAMLNKENNWSHTWEDLPKGHIWTADEVDVPLGYTKSIKTEYNGSQGLVHLTNVYTPPEDKTLQVTKIWAGDSDTNQPKNVTVSLLKNAVVQETINLTPENNWTHTWTALDGHYTWTAEETSTLPIGYTKTTQGNGTDHVTITNTFTAPNTGGPSQESKPDPKPETKPEEDKKDETLPPTEETLPPTEETTPPIGEEDDTTEAGTAPSPESNPTSPPAPTNPGQNLMPNDDGTFLVIDENGVPLGEWHWDEAEEIWIYDEIVPLASAFSDVPNTADRTPVFPIFTFLGTGLLLFIFLRKRSNA